jgi:hypothetical protein
MTWTATSPVLKSRFVFPSVRLRQSIFSPFMPVCVQVIAVPTGRQRYNAPPPSHLKPSAADTAAPSSSSSSDEATKEAIAAAKALEASSSSVAATALPTPGAPARVEWAGERGITSDAARLKAELRQLSRAVTALKHSPRTQATKVYHIYIYIYIYIHLFYYFFFHIALKHGRRVQTFRAARPVSVCVCVCVCARASKRACMRTHSHALTRTHAHTSQTHTQGQNLLRLKP